MIRPHPLLIILALFSSCSFAQENGPNDLPLNTLQAAPDTLRVGEVTLVLETEMWRDFMPIAPPDGHPLVAIFRIYSPETTALPEDLIVEAGWVIHEDDVWETHFADGVMESPPGQLVRIAHGGPKWGPGILVDAVVQVRHNNQTSLLRASDQNIMRTD